MTSEAWKPSAAIDAAVRHWMDAAGLKVSSTRYYADEEVYAWRHDVPGASPTLWLARTVLEDHEPADLVAALDRLGVAERMRTTPNARFLVADEDGRLTVSPWRHGPHTGA
jgi:hypothetical protein